ncbi:MAG: patatin family protein [Clostridia bacterium]|nr:patatin family protein [Clostridia bacterium]MBQ4365749.1 patatin family protein [Clostridia bacterium]
MVGIIDVGGGLRDIYGAGVFDRLLDDGVRFDYCLGVSAGSANVASFLAKQRGRNRRFYLDYSKRKEYMSPSNLYKIGAFLNLHYIYGTLSASDGEDPLDYETLMENDSAFCIVATNAKTGKIEYFGKGDLAKDDYRVLMASSAIPLFARAEKIGGAPCSDGGVGEPIPIMKAFFDGCDRVVLILTMPDGPMQRKRRDLLGAVLLRFIRPNLSRLLLERHNIYNRQLELAHGFADEGRCLIISPDDVCGIKTLTNDTANLERLYEKGYRDAARIKAFVEADVSKK